MGQEIEESKLEVAGARMHFLRAGAGRPVVLIHGLVGSSSNWRRNISVLARRRTVYALDMVNMGESDRVAGLDAGLEATADRVAAFLDAAGIGRADIAGHSHGGAVAMMLAARHPEWVRSLVLFAPANPYSDLGDNLVRIYSTPLGAWMAETVPCLPAWVQQVGLGRMYGDPARIVDGCLAGYMDGLRVPGTVRHILAIVRRWFADMDKLQAALPEISEVPTLLVWGDRDRAVDMRSAAELQQVLRGAELRVVRGGGHVVFEEFPDEANALMVEWLEHEHTAAQAVVARVAGRRAVERTRTRRAPVALPSLSPES